MFFKKIETMKRDKLEVLVEDRIRYTIKYANENSFFYRTWFRKHKVNPNEIRNHADLLNLPIVSGKTIRQNQPPHSEDFHFRSVDWNQVFTIHETSGTSGSPKAFFLTWNDWERYAEKYARASVLTTALASGLASAFVSSVAPSEVAADNSKMGP